MLIICTACCQILSPTFVNKPEWFAGGDLEDGKGNGRQVWNPAVRRQPGTRNLSGHGS